VKRNIIIIISVLIVGLIGFWVLRQLSFGSISITTNDQSGEVTLRQNGVNEKPKKIGKGDTTVRVSPGNYTIEISHDDKVTRGATNVVRGEDSSINLQVKDLKSQEEVVNYTALSIYATNQSLSFFNTPQKLLFKYEFNTEQADILSETYPVSQVYHWYSSDSAFFQTSDGVYYLRNGGKDTPVDLTGDPEAPTAEALDVNNKGELVYIHKGELYYRSSITAADVSIFSIKDTNGAPSLALSNNGDVLISFEPDEPDDNKDSARAVSSAIIVNVATKKKRQLDTAMINGHWAPDSKHFVATTERGLDVFNALGASQGLVSSLLDSNANTATWVDNSRFVYADGSTVWLYTIIDGVSTKIAQIDGSIARNNPFAISGDSIYYETDPKPAAGSVGTIYRIGF